MIMSSVKAHERARGTMKSAQRTGTAIKDHMCSHKDEGKQNATGASKHVRKCENALEIQWWVIVPREMNVVVHDVCEGGIRSSHSKGLFCDSLSLVVVRWSHCGWVSFRGYE
jgi:hypothetical protein